MGNVVVRVPRMRRIAGRWYWWPTPAVKKLGFHSEALGTDLTAATQRAMALNDQVEAERKRLASPSIAPDTVADLIRLYRKDERYTALSPETQRGYRWALDEIERKAGALAVAGITRQSLVKVYQKVKPRGLRTANTLMRLWSVLLGLAYDLGWRDDNPARKLRLRSDPTPTREWSEAEMDAFCRAASASGRASLALAVQIAYGIGQRTTDVLRLTWGQWDGQAFTVRQSKTGRMVKVPALAPLRQAMEAAPRLGVQVVISEATGRPYKPSHFSHEVARIRAAAGLPADLHFRGLRHTKMQALAEADATDAEMQAVSGHTTRGSLNRYQRPSDTLAEKAQRKQERNGKVINLGGPSDKSGSGGRI